MSPRLLYPAALLISAAAIGYEILLMRMLSIVQWHHFAYMIISLALFGYAASGTFIALARRYLTPRFAASFSTCALLFGVTMVTCFVLSQYIPFNPLEIVWNPSQFLNLAAVYLVLLVPFFFAASCIGLAFACHPKQIDKIYFFDLTGAGIGGLFIILALFYLSPQNALIALVLFPVVASALAGLGAATGSRNVLLGAQALTMVAVLLLVPQDWLGLRMSEFKGLSQTMQVVDTEVLEVSSSPLGLLTVVDSPSIPFRHAPGLSFAATRAPHEQLAVFTDGDNMSVITRFDGDASKMSWLADVTSALPYQLLDQPRVLVLGAGGGSSVLQALHHSAANVDAVELNPRVADLVRDRFADFAGNLYEDPRVDLHIGEARGFVTRSDDQYDLIQVALLDSFATSGSGAQGLSESYLYTVEAVQVYLRHTSVDGVLAITRWLKVPPRDSLKLVATSIEALRQSGIADPGRHLAMIRSWNTITLLVTRSELTRQDVSAIRNFARTRSFDTTWYPSMNRDDANRYNYLDEPYLFDGITALLGDDAGQFSMDYKFDIEAATDDRPYFFHFFKWNVLPEVLALSQRGGAGLIEWGYLILIATLVQALLAGVLLILLPLRAIRRSWPRGTGMRMGTYFFLLGLAFLFVEIAFIQKFILFLSHPLYSIAVVLSGFLVFAGLGSALSDRLRENTKAAGISPVMIAVAGIAALAVLYVLLLPAIFNQLIGLTDPAKVAISIVLIAPLALCMGMPFPIGLKHVGDTAPAFIPWAWGINGFASVVSATLATIIAIEFGFSAVVLLAIALYFAAALFTRDW